MCVEGTVKSEIVIGVCKVQIENSLVCLQRKVKSEFAIGVCTVQSVE